LYPNENISFNETILCSNNECVVKWNAIAQERNMNDEHKLLSKDTFEEAEDAHGHINMLTTAVLNKFWKNGVSNCNLILKIGDTC
jgi:hypothetical protein